LITRCLDYFSEALTGFEPEQAIFNFPYNASTPAIEEWLADKVMAFRTGSAQINALPHAGQKR
jgi:16S rRNA A1518/A1519 N6-dimethyltransferase RsmA/KsgA/DIM1 with predicted DNA glycosylase/AP lyase activity